MKKIYCLILAICILFCGCGQQTDENTASESDNSKATIGMCLDTIVVERWLKDRDVFTYEATQLGEKVEVLNANGDVEKQRQQIEHFIDKKVKAIVIVAVDADKITDLVEKAHSAGIDIIAYDRAIDNAPVDLYVCFDDYSVGQHMAEAINEGLSQKGCATKNILMICGPKSDKNVPRVETGFTETGERLGFNVVDVYYTEGWRAENVNLYFDDNPDILDKVDGIMCGNDALASEVIQVLAKSKKAGDIVVAGQDADLDACQRIVEGTQQATVYKSVERMAKLAAEYTVRMINGEDIYESVTNHVDNGYGSIPCVSLTTQLVDKDNMDEIIIESGFHLREDIYINVK